MAKTEKKVLVVDDDEGLLELLNNILTEANFTVFTALDSGRAFEILEAEVIEVIFLDLCLPGESGIDICIKIRKDNAIAIIYAVTAFTDTFDAFDCRYYGFDDIFKKPFNNKEIIGAAKDAFKKLKRWKYI